MTNAYDPTELLCRCGHGEYGHHRIDVYDGRVVNYSCDFKDKRGCCPCLDFHLVPRPRPVFQSVNITSSEGTKKL